MIPCLPEFYFSKAETSVQKQTQEQIEETKLDSLTPFPNFAFHEYLILNLVSQNLQIKQEISQLKQMVQNSQTFTKCSPEVKGAKEERRKRKYERRGQILERKFICGHKNCDRSYSSRIALNSHLRKKHTQKTICSVENVMSD